MTKKIFLKLSLLLLSLSLVSCVQKNDSATTPPPPPDKNIVENKQDNETVPKPTQPEAIEKGYYDLIEEAWQSQKDYIDSIDDPNQKQSVQTAHSAAILKSNELLLEHPEDSTAITESLQKVLAGE